MNNKQHDVYLRGVGGEQNVTCATVEYNRPRCIQ